MFVFFMTRDLGEEVRKMIGKGIPGSGMTSEERVDCERRSKYFSARLEGAKRFYERSRNVVVRVGGEGCGYCNGKGLKF